MSSLLENTGIAVFVNVILDKRMKRQSIHMKGEGKEQETCDSMNALWIFDN
jgi:hypothetical protein